MAVPLPSTSTSNVFPVSAVTLCSAPSALVTVTVAPGDTVTGEANFIPEMAIVGPVAAAGAAAVVEAGEDAGAAGVEVVPEEHAASRTRLASKANIRGVIRGTRNRLGAGSVRLGRLRLALGLTQPDPEACGLADGLFHRPWLPTEFADGLAVVQWALSAHQPQRAQ